MRTTSESPRWPLALLASARISELPRWPLALLASAVFSISVLAAQEAAPGRQPRVDGAERIPITGGGSLQNAAWSPNGTEIVFTRFRRGYNKGPANIEIFDFSTGTTRTLIGGDDQSNVSQPGSTWNARTDRIVFSSTRPGRDEVFMIGSQGRSDTLMQLTSDETHMAYEPSMSPDGQSVVFEAHRLNEETNGVIKRLTLGSAQIEELTPPNEDCRQPNWSPAGDTIVYQKKANGRWDLWIYELSTKKHRRLTEGVGDKTDATFSPDGRWVLYSADSPDLRTAALFATNLSNGQKVQMTNAGVYDGAPSWSPDGKTIVFESMAETTAQPGLLGWLRRVWVRLFKIVQPERPTTLWKIKVPEPVLQDLCPAGSACQRGG